jgi:heat shock protein HtpX
MSERIAAINEVERRTFKLRNVLHSIVLIASIAAITGLCAYIIWGAEALLWVLGALFVIVLFAPRIAPELIMRMFNARPVDPMRGGDIIRILDELARRAGLPATPRLFVIPSPTLNAFATGSRSSASIAVTEALLRKLTLRELAGVLAHEVAHIRNNDLWVMGLADVMSRFTRVLSFIGVFTFFAQLPLALAGWPTIPLSAVILLYLAPAITGLLQLALSRAREYDADLEAARLSGDPEGLAMALTKLERYQGHMWEDIFLPGRRIPQPSVLRTHPATEERVRRLRTLKAVPAEPLRAPEREAVLMGLGVLPRKPYYHWSSYWY